MGRVARLRNDVEIAGQDQRLFVLHELARMGDEPLHEHELVWVFLRTGRIAVRQIDARHPHDAVAGRDDRFEVTGLGVVLVPRQSARDLERPFGENGDAVERLLAVGLDVIAEFLDLHARKLVVEALDLLEAERVGADLLQIIEEVGKPLADRVDIPGGDAQARGSVARGCLQRATVPRKRGGALRTPIHVSTALRWDGGEPDRHCAYGRRDRYLARAIRRRRRA